MSANADSRSTNISSQLVSGVGFSNGWAELALKKPPPLLPISLIHSWEAIGPIAIVWVAPWRVVTTCDRVPRLRNALPDEDERADERDRQEDVEHAAGQVDPVVAERLRAPARQPAEERDGDREAGGRRGEVADGEHGGLGQVRRTGLTRVVLPVGVRLEADRRVEGKVGGHRRDPALVERQDVLDTQHDVARDDRHDGHRQDGDRVGLPALLRGLVDAADRGRRPARPAGGPGSGRPARPPSPCGCSCRGAA